MLKPLLALASLCGMLLAVPGQAATSLTIGDQFYYSSTLLEEAGELQDLPYAIQWKRFNAGGPVVEALNVGSIDVGIVGDTPVIALAARGGPIKVVAVTRNRLDGTAIVVGKDSPIHSVADLAGKRVAIWKGSWSQQLVYSALEQAGLPVDAPQYHYLMPTEAIAALSQGALDATATWEPYVSMVERQGGRILVTAKNLMPAPVYVVANTAHLEEHRAAIGDFVARLQRARDWARQHVDIYAKAWARKNNSDPAIAESWFRRDATWVEPISSQTLKDGQRTADFLVRAGVLAAPYEVTGLYDQSFNHYLQPHPSEASR
ncbi:ABC transporter substrate-binding protein [Azomonas macrocytogenes]|uniref:Putative aliphatic sulfonates-binding protein n=1 Tax=Azomonas macrocytogenes TaxID=69962 RepID=A0A839SXV9_AZOMA|nr:ABC transporter substrate-binding protein [Azomonas macrocytogenes]MBB3102187.1 NitT/TauT family transport system substrate-binding protein [Azomonas macrocytogenes]